MPIAPADEMPASVGTLQPAEEPMMNAQPQPVELANSAKAALPVLEQPGDAPDPAPQKDDAEPRVVEPLVQETLVTAEEMQKPVMDKELVVVLDPLPESRVEKVHELSQVEESGGCADEVT